MRALLFVVLLALSGCVTQPPRSSAGPDPSGACYASEYQSSRLEILFPKVGDIRQNNLMPTMAMLNDPSTPSAEEREAVEYWGNIRIRCVALGREHRARFAPPRYIAVYEPAQQHVIDLTGRLYRGELTYGQFNSARQAAYLDTVARLAEAQRLDQADEQQRVAFRQTQDRENTAQTLQIMQAMQPRQLVPVQTRSGMIYFLTGQWRNGSDQMCRYQDGTVSNIGIGICPLSR